jgi:hypothetical protein
MLNFVASTTTIAQKIGGQISKHIFLQKTKTNLYFNKKRKE